MLARGTQRIVDWRPLLGRRESTVMHGGAVGPTVYLRPYRCSGDAQWNVEVVTAPHCDVPAAAEARYTGTGCATMGATALEPLVHVEQGLGPSGAEQREALLRRVPRACGQGKARG